MNHDDLLTAKEAAELKEVHIRSVYRAIEEKRLPVDNRFPRMLLIRRADLDAWEPSRRMKGKRK